MQDVAGTRTQFLGVSKVFDEFYQTDGRTNVDAGSEGGVDG